MNHQSGKEAARLTLKAIALHQDTGAPWVLFEESSTSWALGLEIGPGEANSILVHLEGLRPSRPLTHDLIIQLFEMNQMKGLSLEFYDLEKEGRFLTRLHYSQGWSKGFLEVRPSDGLALAVRFNLLLVARRDLIPKWVEYQETQGAIPRLKQDLFYWKNHHGTSPGTGF